MVQYMGRIVAMTMFMQESIVTLRPPYGGFFFIGTFLLLAYSKDSMRDARAAATDAFLVYSVMLLLTMMVSPVLSAALNLIRCAVGCVPCHIEENWVVSGRRGSS